MRLLSGSHAGTSTATRASDDGAGLVCGSAIGAWVEDMAKGIHIFSEDSADKGKSFDAKGAKESAKLRKGNKGDMALSGESTAAREAD